MIILRQKNYLFIGGLFFSFLMLSCSKHDDSDQGVNEIRLDYKEFHPFQLRVTKGTSVTFFSNGGGSHSVTGNLFDSGKIKTEETFSYTFNTVGTYSFYCSYHSDNAQERVSIVVE